MLIGDLAAGGDQDALAGGGVPFHGAAEARIDVGLALGHQTELQGTAGSFPVGHRTAAQQPVYRLYQRDPCNESGDQEEIIGTDLPAAVELTITDTEPGMQGDRVSGATKPATVETGLIVQVPLFVGPGEKIKVDTRSGEYLSRA